MASVPQSRPGAFSGGGAGTSSPCVTGPSRKATCPSDPGCKPAVSVRFGSQRNRAEAGAAERVSGQETSTGPVSVIASQLVRLWGRPARRPGSARRPNAAHCPPHVPPALRPGLSSAQPDSQVSPRALHGQRPPPCLPRKAGAPPAGSPVHRHARSWRRAPALADARGTAGAAATGRTSRGPEPVTPELRLCGGAAVTARGVPSASRREGKRHSEATRAPWG